MVTWPETKKGEPFTRQELDQIIVGFMMREMKKVETEMTKQQFEEAMKRLEATGQEGVVESKSI